MPPLPTGAGDRARMILEDLPTERIDEVVSERAEPMKAGHDVRTAVLFGRVGQCDPTRQVLLRFDEVVAVVLMPREAPGFLGLLVHGLVVVEPHVRPDEVLAQIGEHLVCGEASGRLVVEDGKQRKRDRAVLGDAEPLAVEAGQELVALRLERIGGGDHRCQLLVGEHVLEHDESELVELCGLFVREPPERAVMIRPGESGVPRMQSNVGARGHRRRE